MSWADSVMTTALSAVADHSSAAARNAASRIAANVPWNWNPRGLWLARVRQPRDFAPPSAHGGTGPKL
jgi:hypothetical protein